MPRREADPESFPNCRALRETSAALLVQLPDGQEHWFPKSVIRDDSEVYREGDEGELVVDEWFTAKNVIYVARGAPKAPRVEGRRCGTFAEEARVPEDELEGIVADLREADAAGRAKEPAPRQPEVSGKDASIGLLASLGILPKGKT